MKKIIYLLNVNNYEPRITGLTYPLIERWAKKIGARVVIIKGPAFPGWPMMTEKLQIYYLARELDADWHIYLDSDTAINPNLFDFTEHLPFDTVAHFARDVSTVRWRVDDYHRRDGRFIGSGGWLAVASSWCLDLWHPCEDLTPEEIMDRITPSSVEQKAGLKSEHFVDEYIMSRNIARFGLKFTTIFEVMVKLGLANSNHIFHKYLLSEEEKYQKIKELIAAWGV